ncbi:MAG TPA: hypothetical protein P5513_07015 [Candidatus Diapherotrites archaeon]|nr:hypothetical protein [Candidatus Diapherotrites archaeon]
MKEDKAKIFLNRILDRIDSGEFDEHLNIPFASRDLLKSLVKSKMKKKVDTNATPVLSDTDLWHCVEEVRETALYTASVFLKNNILIRDKDGKIVVNEEFLKIFNK